MATLDEQLEMSDDDFMMQLAPAEPVTQVERTPEELEAERVAAEEAAAAQAQVDAETAAAVEAQRQAEEAAAAEAEAKEQPGEVILPGSDDDVSKAKAPITKEQEPTKTPDQLAAEVEAAKAAKPEDGKTAATEVDFKSGYEKIMAPFKANGQTMQAKTPEEVIQLMQMGANYTRKMQELQQHRKTLLMLENNGLMDEGKLNFLIDISKKDPKAIEQLLRDAKTDLTALDLEGESTYQVGNHSVSDDEANFRIVMDDVNSTATGKETLRVIDSTWDHASKEVLWKQPEVMKIINDQRESGVYSRITAEIERRKTFGQIQPGTTFLHVYKQVGDELQAAGAFADLFPQKEKVEPVKPAPVAVKPVLPKPTGTDSKVQAAAVQRPTGQQATPVTIYDMTDEELLKMGKPK